MKNQYKNRDISETQLNKDFEGVLEILLRDQTRSHDSDIDYIRWATHNYSAIGAAYESNQPMTVDLITGDNDNVIMPRFDKSAEVQQQRSRDKAEVFTPSWICNAQNNLVDNAWFGREGVFNIEHDNHTWTPTTEPIIFPEGKSWQDYVEEERLEITCGEAPYLVSRYDTVTGEFIEIEKRIGILDRKLRIINENAKYFATWWKYVKIAFQSTYGFDWQGDNVLLAREALLCTFIEYYENHWKNKTPKSKYILEIAEIISWNIWQMDGLKGVLPNTCHDVEKPHDEEPGFFSEAEDPRPKIKIPCQGCKNNKILEHNGIPALIMNWKEQKIEEFRQALKH